MIAMLISALRIDWSRSIGYNLDKQVGYDVGITEKIFTGPDCYTWREVFAWLPVKTISGKRIWLKKVYKQKYWAVWGRGFHMEPEVEYGDVFDILKDNDE
jgi:hypothetical protein